MKNEAYADARRTKTRVLKNTLLPYAFMLFRHSIKLKYFRLGGLPAQSWGRSALSSPAGCSAAWAI